MSGYDTNLAAEFHVLSVLHRLGLSATLTLGNKKSVDIVVTREAGNAMTLDVKGLAGTTNWPVINSVAKKNHFVVFVSFLGKISEPSVAPEIYVVPSRAIEKIAYRNPKGNYRVIPVGRARRFWAKYRDAWKLLR